MIVGILIAAQALTTVRYSIPDSSQTDYRMAIHFDGYLPILGGKSGVVDAVLGIQVRGLAPDSTGNIRATSQITSAEMTLFGAKLPFGASSLQTMFPKTTISASPQGRVVQTDAPNVHLPVQLPGLDPQRFPDISYLPIEFPPDGIELGKAFEFERSFSNQKLSYKVTPSHIDADSLELRIELTQKFDGHEDAQHNSTAERGAFQLHSELSGAGLAHFDRRRGAFVDTHVETETVTDVEDLSTHEKSTRHLKMTLDLGPAGPVSK